MSGPQRAGHLADTPVVHDHEPVGEIGGERQVVKYDGSDQVMGDGHVADSSGRQLCL